MDEIQAPDPLSDAKDRISSHVSLEDGVRQYALVIDGAEYAYSFDESDAGQWFDEAVIGNITSYFVVDPHLIAALPVQVSPGFFVGEIEIKYELQDKQFSDPQLDYISYIE